jgi:hypothetical protein
MLTSGKRHDEINAQNGNDARKQCAENDIECCHDETQK